MKEADRLAEERALTRLGHGTFDDESDLVILAVLSLWVRYSRGELKLVMTARQKRLGI